jgi:glucose-1-phosphate thymidylyltransferase
MKLLVLAAGYATRLSPLTDNQAKPLLPVRGRPMIDHVLDCFAGCPEIDGVFVVTNHRYAPNFERWQKAAAAARPGWRIRVFDDGTTSNADRLGAIGDIAFVLRQGGEQGAPLDDDLVVVAGDNLFSQPLVPFVKMARRRGLLVGAYDVGDLELIKQYSCLRLDDEARVVSFTEKPQHPESTLACIALYHYPRAVLPLITQYLDEGNSPDQPGWLVQWLYSRVPCYAYTVPGRWLDIGSKQSYDAAQSLI